MKISEMDSHQKLIYKIMDSLTSEYIGGNENTLDDYEEDSEEYKTAKAFLSMGHEAMAKFFYDRVMNECKLGSNATHARFAGSEFLKERIEARLKKWDY